MQHKDSCSSQAFSRKISASFAGILRGVSRTGCLLTDLLRWRLPAAQDLKRSWQVAERLEYGMVGVNETAITAEVAPFGGIKHSGLGREHSKYGLEEFLYIKYIQVWALSPSPPASSDSRRVASRLRWPPLLPATY